MENTNRSESQILYTLNAEEREKMIGGIVFVCVLMVFGIIGNTHVLFVFLSKIKPSNHTTFICFLGVIDMMACTISIPTTLLDLINPLTYYYSTVCKVARNMNYFICWSSALILLVVAFDRYRKICQPMKWQLRNRTAKILCVITVVLSTGLSLPAFLISGHRTIHTRHPNISGTRCSYDDKFIHTYIPTIYNIVLMVIAALMAVSYIVFYGLITRTIVNRRYENAKLMCKMDRGEVRGNNVPTAVLSVFSITLHNENQFHAVSQVQNSRCTTETPGNFSDDGCVRLSASTRNQTIKYKETKRLTVIFFIIIAVYFCSYIPNLIIKLLTFTPYDAYQHLEKTRAILYNTFTWFFYVNNVANPVVYFFLDIKFRKEIKSFYGKLCRCGSSKQQ